MQKLENYQRLHWDVFYKNNKDNFYKDRHYVKAEFKELARALGGHVGDGEEGEAMGEE